MISVPEGSRLRLWQGAVALLVTLACGTGLGLLVSWELWPVEYTDVAPASLNTAHREEYVLLAAKAYAYSGDLGAAEARLVSLGDREAVGAEVAALASRYIVKGQSAEDLQALSALAFGLGHPRVALATFLPTGTPVTPEAATLTAAAPTSIPTETSTPTSTPPPTPTVVPTSTPTATPSPPATPTPSVAPTRQRQTATPTRVTRPTSAPTPTPTPEPRFEVMRLQRTCQEPHGRLMVTVLDHPG